MDYFIDESCHIGYPLYVGVSSTAEISKYKHDRLPHDCNVFVDILYITAPLWSYCDSNNKGYTTKDIFLVIKLSNKYSSGQDTKNVAPQTKIALNTKASTMKVCICVLTIATLTLYPYPTNAGFISDMVTRVLGTQADAESQNDNKQSNTDTIIHNSQTLPLLESSVNPDIKSIKDIKPQIVFEDEALMPNNNLIDVDNELDKYASSAKINVYVVKSGDTLDAIARKFKTSKAAIIASNADIKINKIKIGQKIVILSAENEIVETKPIEKEKSPIKTNKDAATIQPKFVAKEPATTPKKIVEDTKDTPSIETPTSSSTIETNKNEIDDNKDDSQDSTSTQNTDISKENTLGYIWPFPNGVGRISQGIHADQAYDFAAPKGTPIYAPYDGEVLIAKTTGYNGGYGLYVVINFTDGRQAIFGHMSKVASSSGDTVKKGDIIGYVGSTGKSTGPHVHIGFRGGLSNPYKGLKVNSNSIEDHD